MTTPPPQNKKNGRKRNRSKRLPRGKGQDDLRQEQHHSSLPKKAQQQQNRNRNHHSSIPSDLVQDIEEQLRRQREKKQKLEQIGNSAAKRDGSVASAAAQSPANPKRVLGQFQYDDERQTYFPIEAISSLTVNSSKAAVKSPVDPFESAALPKWSGYLPGTTSSSSSYPYRDSATTVRLPALRHATQSCYDASIRSQIQSLCVGRVLRDGMKIVPNVAVSRQGIRRRRGHESWSFMLPLVQAPHPQQEIQIPLDLTMKTLLHPSSRTFAVAETYPSQANFLPAIASLGTNCLYYMPSERQESAPVIAGGFRKFEEPLSIQMVRAIHGRYNNNRNSFMSLVNLASDVNEVAFYRSNHGHVDKDVGSVLFYYDGPIHDVAYVSHSNRVLVAQGHLRNSKERLRPFRIDLNSEPRTFEYGSNSCSALRCPRYPQSDALCLEVNNVNPNVVVYGHRNGQVSMVDFRTPQECETVTVAPNNNNGRLCFGSTTSLALPKQDPYWIVARGSMGVARLYDVRKLPGLIIAKGCTTANRPLNVRKCAASSPDGDYIHEFIVPSELIHPSLTSRCCNGLALDPAGETIIAPYINHQEEACFGLWSLRSGRMVGSKQISTNTHNYLTTASDGNTELSWSSKTLPYCELCSTPTNAWDWVYRGDGIDKDNDVDQGDIDQDQSGFGPGVMPGFQSVQVKGRWGLWFKLGRPIVRRNYNGTSHPTALTSSIHHVTFPGRLWGA